MIVPSEVIEKLQNLSPQIKEIMAGTSGQVIFNCSREPKHVPTVNLMLADVTKEKK